MNMIWHTIERPMVRGYECPVILYNRHCLASKHEAIFSEFASWVTVNTANFDVMNTMSIPDFTLTDLFIDCKV